MKVRSSEHGFALITAILVIVILAVLSMAIVSSSVSNHAQAMQSVDRARSLALAEGAASLLLAELSDDATGPVKNIASYAEDGTGYVRTYTPFDAGDGQARVELYYTQADESGTLVPVTFGTRSNPIDPYSNLRAVVTGIRPTNERSIEIDFTQGFVLFNDAIACDAIPLGTGAWDKSLAMLGHIVFNDKGRPGQFYINGDMSANGGVYYRSAATPLQTELVNNYFSFAGEINADLAGTDAQLDDYTNPGSTDQLFDFGRVIAACRAGSGQEYTSYSQFVNAMNAANAGKRCL